MTQKKAFPLPGGRFEERWVRRGRGFGRPRPGGRTPYTLNGSSGGSKTPRRQSH